MPGWVLFLRQLLGVSTAAASVSVTTVDCWSIMSGTFLLETLTHIVRTSTGFDKRSRRNRSGHGRQYTRRRDPDVPGSRAARAVRTRARDRHASSGRPGQSSTTGRSPDHRSRVMDTRTLQAWSPIGSRVRSSRHCSQADLQVVATEILGLGVGATAPRDRDRDPLAPGGRPGRSGRSAVADDDRGHHATWSARRAGASGAVRIQGDALILDTGPLIDRLATAVDARLAPGTITIPPRPIRTNRAIESEALETPRARR